MRRFKTSEYRLKSGGETFRARWFVGRTWHSKTFQTAADRLSWIREQLREDRAREAVQRTARTAGEYVARFSRLPEDVQSALLAQWDDIRNAGGKASDIRSAGEDHVGRMGGGVTVAEAVEGHLRALDGTRSSRTVYERRRYLAEIVRERGGEHLCALTRAVCIEWINRGTVSTVSHRHAALSAFLAWAARMDMVKASPIAGLPKPAASRAEEVAIFSAAEAETVMRTVVRVAPRLVPYAAIGLFAGLRPDKELRRLEARDVDLEGGAIYIRRKNAKTGQARMVPIAGNLKAWLAAYPIDVAVWWSRSAWRRVQAETGLEFAHDVMRHTRASFRLAETMDAVRTAEEMGHDVAVLRSNYANRRIPPAEVGRFWGIRP